MNNALLWSIIFVVLIAAAIYFVVNNIKNNIDFRFDVTGIDPSTLQLNEIGTNQGYIIVNVKSTILNNSITSFSFSKLRTSIYYNNVVVATSDKPLKSISVNRKSHTDFYIPMRVYINANTISFLLDIRSGRANQFQYDAQFNALGFYPVKINETYTINQQ